MFNFSEHLLAQINCDQDGEYLPLPALDSLSDLSPLTSPEPSPPSSPHISTSASLPSTTPLFLPCSTAHEISQYRASIQAPPRNPGNDPTSKNEPEHQQRKGKPAHRKARQHAAQAAWRKNKRTDKREDVMGHYQGRESARKKYMDTAPSVSCSWDASTAHVASSAHTALDDGSGLQKAYKLEDLVGEHSKFGFKLVKWDGHTPTALVDCAGRVVGILAGHPEDSNWPQLHKQAADALESRRNRCHIPKGQGKHRRGKFPALRSGVSHGGGQRAPGNLLNSSPNAEVLKELNGLEPFQRLAGFSSSVLATWAPLLHAYYSNTINELHASDPSLIRIFPSSVFSAVSYNLGPRTMCFRHKDFANLPFGYCAVTALGTFDPTRSGHLILWELKIVVEFPPGSTILLPSAIVAHSNVSLDNKEDRRYSFAQYSAGGIFRWIDNCCKTRETYLSGLAPEEREHDNARNEARWRYGLSLFPTRATEEHKDPKVVEPSA